MRHQNKQFFQTTTMEFLYAIFPKQQPILNNSVFLVSVSNANIVAFTTQDLQPGKPGTNDQFFCYIADLNTPWQPIEIYSGSSQITTIEWDKTGKYLLVADIGHVRIFSKSACFNWQETQVVRFPGEIILRAAFFDDGTTVQFHYEKKDVQSYYEKYTIVKNKPGLADFGGVSAEGCIVVSSSGMVGAFTISSESEGKKMVTESLGVTRNLYTLADITFQKDGQALIAVSNGGNASNGNMIRCFRIKVLLDKLTRDLSLTSRSMPSFFLTEGHGQDLSDLKLTKLKWTSPDSILVGTNYAGGSYIETWTLQEKTMSIHKVFKAASSWSQDMAGNNKGDVFRTQCWQNLFYSRFPAKIKDFCMTKIRVFASDVLFVVLQDSSVHCLIRDSLKVAATVQLSYAVPADSGDHSPVKQNKVSVCPDSIDITALGHNIIVMEKGVIYVYGVTSSTFFSSMMSAQQIGGYVANLLEYSMVAGVDYLDVILASRISNYDAIIERINENFNRQTGQFQQYYYVRFLTLKTNLYRFSTHGQGKANDLSCLLILHSILIAFKNLLRPSDMTSQDKGPAENLAMVLSESNVDIDKVLLKLDAKDFTVEPSTLQSLQQLIQWVADLTLSRILVRLPENRCNGNRSSGYDISKDIVALNSIRELLVMIRMWGLLKAQCLPVFCRFSDNDVLATVFRLLTKLALNPVEPDDMLLDECCLLPNQVSIPNLPVVSQKAALVSALLNQIPIYLEFNCEPGFKFSMDTSSYFTNTSANLMDSIRHLQLGKRPHNSLRKCLRCGAWSGTGIIAKSVAMKSWEQRWINECRCGGYWRLQNAC